MDTQRRAPVMERHELGQIYQEKTIRQLAEERQLRLSQRDAELPPMLRETYGIVVRRAIDEQFREEWIALLPTHVDDKSNLVRGRLFGHAPTRAELDAELEPIRQAHPGLPLCVYYTGDRPVGETFVRV